MFYISKVCIAVIVAFLAVPCVCAESRMLNITGMPNSGNFSTSGSHLKQKACFGSSQCQKDGTSCVCYPNFYGTGINYCVDAVVFETEMAKCSCLNDDYCSKSEYCAYPGYCSECWANASTTATAKCSSRSSQASGSGVSTLEQSQSLPEQTASPQGDGSCVETEWLGTNGLSSGILRESGVAKTLCMEGLPCGTEGHLLRVCDVHGECALKSYKQVCEKRGDCEVKYTEVSRLSAKVDWSVVKLDECMDDGSTASLTSLSVHADGGDLGLSWMIAKIGEKLIGAGLGGAVDVFVLMWEDIGNHCDEVLRMMATAVGK